eukprot:2629827-Karenia_brevis.AAC.1
MNCGGSGNLPQCFSAPAWAHALSVVAIAGHLSPLLIGVTAEEVKARTDECFSQRLASIV